MNKPSALGTRLKAARTAKGLTLTEVEALCGVSTAVISKTERDLNKISAASLIKLATCYGVSFYDLAHIETDLGDDGKAILEGYLAEIAHARAELNNVLDGLERLATAILTERKVP